MATDTAEDHGSSADADTHRVAETAVLVERVRHLAAWIGDERWKDRGGAGKAWNARYVLIEAADRLAAGRAGEGAAPDLLNALRHYACSCEQGQCAMSASEDGIPVDDTLCGMTAQRAISKAVSQ